MPTIAFTHHLQRHAPAQPVQVAAATPRLALEAVFATHPMLRSYVLDEQGALRKHIALFINGELHRELLDGEVDDTAQIYVMQALSGG